MCWYIRRTGLLLLFGLYVLSASGVFEGVAWRIWRLKGQWVHSRAWKYGCAMLTDAA